MTRFQLGVTNITKTLKLGHHAQIDVSHQEKDKIKQNEDIEFRYAIATELNNIGASFYEYGEYSSAMELYKDAIKLLTAIVRDSQHDPSPSHSQTAIQKIMQAKMKLHHIMDSSNKSRSEDKLDFFHTTETVSFCKQAPRCLCKAFKIDTTATENKINMDCAIVFFNIGLISHKEGLFSGALQVYENAVVFGSRSSQPLLLAAAFNNMGQIHYEHGSLDRAMENFHEALRFSQDARGRVSNSEATKSSRYISIIMSNMGRVHFVMDQYDEALDMCLNAFAVQRSALGNNDLEMSVLLFNIGLIQQRRKKENECMGMYKRFLTIISRPRNDDMFSSRDNATGFGISLNHIGQTYEQLGMMNEAEKCYKVALDLGKAHVRTHKIFAILTYNIGMIIYQREEYDKATEVLGDSIELLRQILGDDHPDIAAILYDIGIVQKEAGKVTEALVSFNKSCHLRRLFFGNNHHIVAEALFKIGTIYHEMGENKKAMEVLQETVQIEKMTLGESHTSVAMTLCIIGQIHVSTGELGQALKAFEEALCITRTNEVREISSKNIYSAIGKIYHQKGEIEKAMTYFEMAGGAQMSLLSKAIAA